MAILEWLPEAGGQVIEVRGPENLRDISLGDLYSLGSNSKPLQEGSLQGISAFLRPCEGVGSGLGSAASSTSVVYKASHRKLWRGRFITSDIAFVSS